MFTKKIVYSINYNDLEELFARVFSNLQDYCFVSDQEAGNNSLHSFTVTSLDGDEAQAALDAINNDASYNIVLDALNVMCYKGFISPGEYLVEVSW